MYIYMCETQQSVYTHIYILASVFKTRIEHKLTKLDIRHLINITYNTLYFTTHSKRKKKLVFIRHMLNFFKQKQTCSLLCGVD